MGKYRDGTDLILSVGGHALGHSTECKISYKAETGTRKTKEAAAFETHRRMLDIQIPLDAPETYGYIPLEDMPEAEYNEEKDVTKYKDVVAETYVNCKPGEFAIFFPQDGHQPCIGEGQIRKAIFKVKA